MSSRKQRILPSSCRICGAFAKYSYFGAISCQACKMFFKRNALSAPNKSICLLDNQCEIIGGGRAMCSSCRLRKCFQSGMTAEKFRASIKKKNKKLLALQSVNCGSSRALNQPAKLTTLNLLEKDISLLTTDQWNLMTNLHRSYQESTILSTAQRFYELFQARQMTESIADVVVQEYLTSIYNTAGLFFRSNADLNQLSSSDRSVILHRAADRISCMSGTLGIYHYHLLALEPFLRCIIRIYGEKSVEITSWSLKFIDPDMIVSKLGLFLFAVSSNISTDPSEPSINLLDPLYVFKIQNKYAEVTWKYLRYKYGYSEAVKRFLNLINWFQALTVFIVHAQSLTRHVDDVESLVEQTEITLILDDADQIMNMN